VVVVLASPYLKVSLGIGEKVSSNWEEAVMQAVSSPELRPCFASESSVTRRTLEIEGKQAWTSGGKWGTSEIYGHTAEILAEGITTSSRTS